MSGSGDRVDERQAQAKQLRDRAVSDPRRAVDDVPRLVELLDAESGPALTAARGLVAVASHDPSAVESAYPAAVEAILDRQEARAAAERLVTGAYDLRVSGVPPETIADGYLRVADAVSERLAAVADATPGSADELPGGGAAVIEFVAGLRGEAGSIGGREQLAFEAAADGVEGIVTHRARRWDYDPIDVLVDLRSMADRGDGPLTGGLLRQDGIVSDVHDAGETVPVGSLANTITAALLGASLIVLVERPRGDLLRVAAVLADRVD